MSTTTTPKAMREAKDLSVARLSRLADVDRRTVDRIEDGLDVAVSSLEAVAAVLGVTASELLEASLEARTA